MTVTWRSHDSACDTSVFPHDSRSCAGHRTLYCEDCIF